MPTLAAGLLVATSARLYRVEVGFEAEVCVSYANDDASTPTTGNLHIDAAGFAKFRRIGKNTVIPAAGTVEVGDTTPICLGAGDELWGDSAAAVHYIITGKVVRA